MQPNISKIANLIGDPARASMLLALMGGKALTATELALEADITPQTASSHLGKLVGGNLLVVRKQGRHKYFQLRDYEIAQLLENLLTISIETNRSKVTTGPKNPALRTARVCYDHLAGSIGVALFNSLLKNGFITEDGEVTLLTESGRAYFEEIGVNFEEINRVKSKRPLCKSCLDWSERKSHLSGKLGKWIFDDILANDWANRESDSRVINFNDTGLMCFKLKYKINV